MTSHRVRAIATSLAVVLAPVAGAVWAQNQTPAPAQTAPAPMTANALQAAIAKAVADVKASGADVKAAEAAKANGWDAATQAREAEHTLQLAIAAVIEASIAESGVSPDVVVAAMSQAVLSGGIPSRLAAASLSQVNPDLASGVVATLVQTSMGAAQEMIVAMESNGIGDTTKAIALVAQTSPVAAAKLAAIAAPINGNTSFVAVVARESPAAAALVATAVIQALPERAALIAEEVAYVTGNLALSNQVAAAVLKYAPGEAAQVAAAVSQGIANYNLVWGDAPGATTQSVITASTDNGGGTTVLSSLSSTANTASGDTGGTTTGGGATTTTTTAPYDPCAGVIAAYCGS